MVSLVQPDETIVYEWTENYRPWSINPKISLILYINTLFQNIWVKFITYRLIRMFEKKYKYQIVLHEEEQKIFIHVKVISE